MDLTLRRLEPGDRDRLQAFLDALSPETRRRFGPHPFDPATVAALCEAAPTDAATWRWLALDAEGQVLGYALARRGHLSHDAVRIAGYGAPLVEPEDAFFAPAVADRSQARGLGTALLEQAAAELRADGRRRLFLWGGVQKDNARAVAYYLRNGFELLGEFEHQGWNLDMVKAL
ncbi:MAG: GNAT family N-acetyltransferase [Anaeromyxobacter sp.]